MIYYTTMTSKGQITIPVAIRQQMELLTGRKYRMRAKGDQIIIEKNPATELEILRARAEKIMRANGTWGKPVDRDAMWTDYVKEKYGQF